MPWVAVHTEFVMTAAEILDECVPGTDHSCRTEPELSPVRHTATDSTRSAGENQQVNTTEAQIPGTPDETVQGIKSPLLRMSRSVG
jgi:hypothetical protein